MAFIPIIAKADVADSKKGKIAPAQMAQEIAFALRKKTGIFNITGRRCEATASTPSNNKSTITFDAGYIVICGRLVEVEQGTTLEIDTPVSGSEDSYIIATFDLASVEENEFTVTAVPSSHTLIQQDLNNNPVGKYELVIYSYTATSSSVILSRTSSIYIDDIDGVISSIQTSIGTINSNISSINSRLDALGFSKTTATIFEYQNSYGSGQYRSVGTAYLYRLGRFVICRLSISSNSTPDVLMPYICIKYNSSLKPYLKGTYAPQGTTISLPNDYDVGGRGMYVQNNHSVPAWDKVTISTSENQTNFLISQGTICGKIVTGSMPTTEYLTMAFMDVTLGWTGIDLDS